MGVPLGGEGKEGGRFSDNVKITSSKSDHSRAVYCYAITSVPVWGDIDYTGGTSGDVMVRAGRHRRGRGNGGGRGGGKGWGRGVTQRKTIT